MSIPPLASLGYCSLRVLRVLRLVFLADATKLYCRPCIPPTRVGVLRAISVKADKGRNPAAVVVEESIGLRENTRDLPELACTQHLPGP